MFPKKGVYLRRDRKIIIVNHIFVDPYDEQNLYFVICTLLFIIRHKVYLVVSVACFVNMDRRWCTLIVTGDPGLAEAPVNHDIPYLKFLDMACKIFRIQQWESINTNIATRSSSYITQS